MQLFAMLTIIPYLVEHFCPKLIYVVGSALTAESILQGLRVAQAAVTERWP